eukprot:4938893-Amphidinium_carterae.1
MQRTPASEKHEQRGREAYGQMGGCKCNDESMNLMIQIHDIVGPTGAAYKYRPRQTHIFRLMSRRLCKKQWAQRNTPT